MKLDLSEILGRVGMRYTYPVDEPPIVDEDLECVAPITGTIVFANTGSVLLIDGSVQTTVVLPCGRCLAYFREPVHLPISEQFELQAKPAGRGNRQTHVVIEEDESPIAGKLFDGPLFDLSEMLRQGIMLSLPTRPLHDEECKGLCAQCGKDLNGGPCDCHLDTSHHGLAKLGALLHERKNDKS
jgi:Predicted metal-binding, possibly nucleic acid-binding protein